MFEDKELTYYEKQTILYFKCHFQITDLMNDLKVFVGKHYCLDVDQVKGYNVYNFVVKLYCKLVNMGVITAKLEDFILDLFGYEKSIDHLGLIKKLRGEIQGCKTRALELGEPDFELIPRSVNHLEYLRNSD